MPDYTANYRLVAQCSALMERPLPAICSITARAARGGRGAGTDGSRCGEDMPHA